MIFDGFTFFNETEVLKLRLTELWDVVDRFILVEAPYTHTGNKKPLYYGDNLETFQPFSSKIIHVVVDDLPRDSNPWVPENFQREAIRRGLSEASSEDWVMVSDVDDFIDCPSKCIPSATC